MRLSIHLAADYIDCCSGMATDGEAAVLMSAIASRLASTNSHIRLKVVDTMRAALRETKAFWAGQVDLAVVRSDIGDLSAARTIVLLTHGVVMIIGSRARTSRVWMISRARSWELSGEKTKSSRGRNSDPGI